MSFAGDTVLKNPVQIGKAGFAAKMSDYSGTNLNACYQCFICANSCPFISAMDYSPTGVIRLIQYAMIQELLECSTPWICVGCYTCSVNCPMDIDIPSMMDVIRQLALEKENRIAEPDILNFHREILDSINRYGRTHKLEIMIRYKLVKKDWLSDMDIGIKMLLKRKLDLTPSRVKKLDDVRKAFNTPME
jgi:heterodisulfide reductase subunit C